MNIYLSHFSLFPLYQFFVKDLCEKTHTINIITEEHVDIDTL